MEQRIHQFEIRFMGDGEVADHEIPVIDRVALIRSDAGNSIERDRSIERRGVTCTAAGSQNGPAREDNVHFVSSTVRPKVEIGTARNSDRSRPVKIRATLKTENPLCHINRTRIRDRGIHDGKLPRSHFRQRESTHVETGGATRVSHIPPAVGPERRIVGQDNSTESTRL